MKINSTIKKLARMALPAALAVSVMPAALAKSVRLDVQMSTPTVLTGARQKAFVRIALTGLTPRVNRRAPVNVAIVLDRSGSMSGTKIEEAKRAALMAIGQLRDDDIVSIVTYQSTVDVLVPATKLYDRDAIRDAIRSIRAGGKTALFAGVSKGARELKKFLNTPATFRRAGQRRPEFTRRIGAARHFVGTSGCHGHDNRPRSAIQRGPDDSAGDGE